MTDPPPVDRETGADRFRRTLMRVMTVQVVTLIVLWLVQRYFSV